MGFIISILLGLLPEVLYFTLFVIYTKNIKEKRIILYFFLAIGYVVCIMTIRFQMFFYLVFVVYFYILLKILYDKKTQIIDIFIIGISYLWLSLLSYVLMFFVNKDYSNYYVIYTIQRLLLFIPLLFKSKFNLLYSKYCKLWNRNDKEKRIFKSITLRNISLIILNCIIFFLNIIIINIINFSN